MSGDQKKRPRGGEGKLHKKDARRTTLATTGTLVDTGEVTVSVVAVVSVVAEADAPPGALVLAGAEAGVVLVDADVVRGLVVPVVSLSDAVVLLEMVVAVADVPVVVEEEEEEGGEEEGYAWDVEGPRHRYRVRVRRMGSRGRRLMSSRL